MITAYGSVRSWETHAHPPPTDHWKQLVYFVITVSCSHLNIFIYELSTNLEQQWPEPLQEMHLCTPHTLQTKPSTENTQSSFQQVSVSASCTIMLCFAKLNSHLKLKILKTKCIWDSRLIQVVILITLFSNGVSHSLPSKPRREAMQCNL